ncbi:RNA polymerase sigma factor [Euzebya tangerina]|uniref:RNA polymerase sigma factor n=1 Tax=Euzebya tangerina TaxID=591198 RepID=UPI0013C2EF0E|nr:RNA polymerase sigma factor [Euzebya tangerina]
MSETHASGGELDDEQLVADFVAGDEQAYAALMDRYARRVHGICYRYFGNTTDAEDAAQDAFVTLYRKAHLFSGKSKFSTWMYRVTTNACNDLGRKRARRPQKADAEVSDLQLEEPTDAIGQKTLQLELRKALMQLEPDYRDAVVAHTVEGHPYADIAERTGVAVGTIKSRVHRGHAKLAKILSGEPSGRAPPHT